MSHEIKRKVVLASVLKPIDDTRMLEKIGATLQASGEFEVFIIGYPSTADISSNDISILPLPSFSRTSMKRLIMPWIVLKKINRIKPDLVIINTPELLFVTVLSKILYKRKIVYDVLENYYRNILYTKTYPWIVRPLLAIFTRATEVILSPFVNHFFLAERGYQQEISFLKPATIAENKLPKAVADQYPIERAVYTDLLFTGTLGSGTGVFEAIAIAKELHRLNPAYTLTIVGYSPVREVVAEISKHIEDHSFITLKGGDKLVPHTEILKAISQAGTGIIIYPHNPGTESSIPTKLYEYLALKLPILIRHTKPSTEWVEQLNAGIVLNQSIDYAQLDRQLSGSHFTFSASDSIYWEDDGRKVLAALKTL